MCVCVCVCVCVSFSFGGGGRVPLLVAVPRFGRWYKENKRKTIMLWGWGGP